MWEAFGRSDFERALSAFHPNVEWDGRNLPDGKLAHGHEAIIDHATRWAELWETWTIKVEEYIDAGDDVVIVFREHAKGESGVEVGETHAEVYTVEEGKIVRRRGYHDVDEALRDVGLQSGK